MHKKIIEVLKFLFEPSAFKLGLLITCAFVYTAHVYYNTPSEQREQNGWLNVIMMAHQKSIDLRMVSRGERAGDERVALLVIDEPALETLGRWPWPRAKIADMIERMRSHGSGVIAFDAVFAEPEINPAMKTLSAIKEKATGDLQEVIDRELAAADSDSILGQTVETHADNLVLGAYFDYKLDNYYPYQEYCGAYVEAKTPEHKYFENEERPVILLDDQAIEAPENLTGPLQAHLDNIEKKINEGIDTSTMNPHERLAHRNKLETALRDYCDRWLVEGKDENLDMIRGPASQVDPTEFMYSVMSNNILRTGRWWMNVAPVSKVTKFFGYFNAMPDSDGTLRYSKLISRYGNQIIPSIALKSIMVHQKLGAIVTMTVNPAEPDAKSVKEIVLTDLESGEPVRSIPVDTQGRLAINYAGGRYSFPHLSVGELYNGKDTAKITVKVNGVVEEKIVNKSEFIKDKIFLFGATATGIYDLRVTPFEENFPGPETHTNIMDNLLREDYLRTPSEEPAYMVAGLAGAGLLFTGVATYMGAVIGLLFMLIAISAIVYLDQMFLFGSGMVVTIVFPLFLIGALYTALTFYKYLTEERKKKELKGTFQKYVSPAVVDEILKNPKNLNLGGQKKRMTVMFSDVRGFTTISEKLDPTKLSDILNAYLTPMTRIVFETKGTLDKYMGDAIMAFWGAPIELPQHAKQACECALLMMKKLAEICAEFRAQGLPDIDIGIGINTGDMSVGNMGSDIVRSYTVMGDSVNLGSRLEGINKEYGTHIIISQFTFDEVKNDFTCREIDWVRVKGKKEPVRIFELVGNKNVDQTTATKLESFQKGFDLYHKGQFQEAMTHFQAACDIDPNDGPSKLYVKRCSYFISEPPPADWDGVYEMKTK